MSTDKQAQKAVTTLISKATAANELCLMRAVCHVNDLLSVLKAVADGVLEIAPDIGDEQRREICRELAVMRMSARQCLNELGEEQSEGSFHLLREGGDAHA